MKTLRRIPMSSQVFGWQSLLHTDAPVDCQLEQALFTTYDRADEQLLAEHLLPMLLRLDRDPTADGPERPYFLVELDERLKKLNGRLIVVSSAVRDEHDGDDDAASGMYSWLWRHIRYLTVGRDRKAVQHSKLWILHWKSRTTASEYVEIVVSSANLTRDALRGQLQAAWRVCLELSPSGTERKRAGWGILPTFLHELGTSAGAKEQLKPFSELLARTECPDGVTFVASVPGKHTTMRLRQTPWGSAGLSKVMPSGNGTVKVSILAPFVGSWSGDSLKKWCAKFRGKPDALKLVWIGESHPWAAQWIMPRATLISLEETGAQLLRLTDDEGSAHRFHLEHRKEDPRWSHAKVYSFERRHSQGLLITSANFSAAAWGKEDHNGSLTIENFELGVCVEDVAFPFSKLTKLPSCQAWTKEHPSRPSVSIHWARADWDGSQVSVEVRGQERDEVKGVILGAEQPNPATRPIPPLRLVSGGHVLTAEVKWTKSMGLPSVARLTCGPEVLSVPIFDGRKLIDKESDAPPELDPNEAERLRDELLFEAYGGPVAGDVISRDGDLRGTPSDSVLADSYAVQGHERARLYLGMVDKWAETLASERQEESAHRDGARLADALRRQVERDGKIQATLCIGAKLAVEEMDLLLKQPGRQNATK